MYRVHLVAPGLAVKYRLQFSEFSRVLRGQVTGLAEVLLEMGSRAGEPAGRGIRLSERLTHQVLADLAGAHRATVTTLLNDWLYDGILEMSDDHRLTLRRPADLWALAGYHPSP